LYLKKTWTSNDFSLAVTNLLLISIVHAGGAQDHSLIALVIAPSWLFFAFLWVYVSFVETYTEGMIGLVKSLNLSQWRIEKNDVEVICRFPCPFSPLVLSNTMPIFTESFKTFRYVSAKERKNLNVYLMKVFLVFLSCCK
jgi:hypothetical protein